MGFSLEDEHVLAVQSAAPTAGGGGVVFGEEVVGGGPDFGDVVEVGVFREGATEAGEGMAAGVGGGGGGEVGSWFVWGGGRVVRGGGVGCWG